METIDLFQAIEEMKVITSAGRCFSFKFRKWNKDKKKGGDLVTVAQAQLRPKASDEDIENSSYKLYFTDLEANTSRVCWQPLITEFNGKKIVLN